MNINLRQAPSTGSRVRGEQMEIRLPCHIRPPSDNHLNCPETSKRKGMWRRGLGGNYIDTKTFNPHLKIISVLVKQWAFMKRVPYVCMELIQCDGLWVYGLDYKTLSNRLFSRVHVTFLKEQKGTNVLLEKRNSNIIITEVLFVQNKLSIFVHKIAKIKQPPVALKAFLMITHLYQKFLIDSNHICTFGKPPGATCLARGHNDSLLVPFGN